MLTFIVLGIMVTIGPLFTIWAINTVFAVGIPFTFWTWLAVAWLHMVFANSGNANNR